jgi:hypothetical protein
VCAGLPDNLPSCEINQCPIRRGAFSPHDAQTIAHVLVRHSKLLSDAR